jgi:hypothetical protein
MQDKIPEPTIGRVVYYYHTGVDKEMAAMVCDVVGPLTVNLGVLNHNGSGGGVVGVPHTSVSGGKPPCWDWMPFQKGQAAKTEALQKELDEKVLDKKAKG